MTLLEWYVARSSGIVAFVFLTLAVAAGLLLAGRARLPLWPRFAVEDVHRFLGLLTGTFVGLHVLTLFVDAYLPFSLAQLTIPFASSYRPLPTALGVVGAELLLALALTNTYRKRLSHRFWRRAHYLNFFVWLFALAHGLFGGTDAHAGWAVAIYLGAAGVVSSLVVWRVLTPPPARPVARAL
jgi:sulfoxide reductase heme-binding subunit YedZ